MEPPRCSLLQIDELQKKRELMKQAEMYRHGGELTRIFVALLRRCHHPQMFVRRRALRFFQPNSSRRRWQHSTIAARAKQWRLP